MRVETAEKPFELTGSKDLNDIQLKRIKLHEKGLIFNAYNFYVRKILSYTCVCSLTLLGLWGS